MLNEQLYQSMYILMVQLSRLDLLEEAARQQSWQLGPFLPQVQLACTTKYSHNLLINSSRLNSNYCHINNNWHNWTNNGRKLTVNESNHASHKIWWVKFICVHNNNIINASTHLYTCLSLFTEPRIHKNIPKHSIRTSCKLSFLYMQTANQILSRHADTCISTNADVSKSQTEK